MSRSRAKSPLLAIAQSLAALATLTLTACPNGDVGAPCNHGTVNPPSSFLVTFPALSCNDLLCIYGENQPIDDTIDCTDDFSCNPDGGNVFACNDGDCELSLDYVLDRSMCSKRCSSDSDCENGGAFDKPVVEDDETACSNGFKCVVLQDLGQFCCEKLCVCNDDLPNLSQTEMNCADIDPATGEPAVCVDNG